jgi:hypothetical protein
MSLMKERMRRRDSYIKAIKFLCAALSPWTTEAQHEQLLKNASKGNVDWSAVALCANNHNLAADLFWCLERNSVDYCLPSNFYEYLREIHRFNKERNQQLTRELVDIVDWLNQIDITPTLLKGSAALIARMYPDRGMRFMWDLDLLVPDEKMNDCVSMLGAHGYKALNPHNYEGNKHYAPLFRAEAAASIELHRRLTDEERDIICSRALCQDRLPSESPLLKGLSATVLSPTDEIIHCFYHSEMSHKNHERGLLDLRQLFHFSYLCFGYQSDIERSRLETLHSDRHLGPAFRSYLYLAKEFFHVGLPIDVDRDVYAENHYQCVISNYYVGWRRARMLLSLSFENAVKALSESNLRRVYPERDKPIALLRFKYFLVLLARYAQWETLRQKINGLLPS